MKIVIVIGEMRVEIERPRFEDGNYNSARDHAIAYLKEAITTAVAAYKEVHPENKSITE